MENESLILSALERIEKRQDKFDEKLDAITETVNAMKVNAAGCNAHFEEIDRQVEALETKDEKRVESVGTKIGIATGVTALLAFVGQLLYNVIENFLDGK